MPELSKEFPFKIGCDPEFSIVSQKKSLHAAATIELFFKNDSKYNKRQMGYIKEGDPAGEIGWDGHSATGELRPKPHKKPAAVIEHLRALIHGFSEKCGLFDMTTLCEFEPIGGHIIFDIVNPEELWDSHADGTYEDLPNSVPANKRTEKLNAMMASFYIPILLSEHKASVKRRLQSGGYGSLNDYRIERRGGKLAYEFRAPTAEWTTTPHVAEATLSYLGAVYHELTSDWKHAVKRFGDIFFHTKEQGQALQTLLMSPFDVFQEEIIKRIKKHVRTLSLYPNFKDEIEFILNPERAKKEKENANYNLITGWNAPSATQPKKRTIMSDRAFKERASKINIEEFARISPFSCNSDRNVDVFAKELQKRVIAFNWKINKTYFLFGLRKGIASLIAQDLNRFVYAGQELWKTKEDAVELSNLFERMRTRLNAKSRFSRTREEIEKDQSNVILIGIPYEDRVTLTIKPFISLVHDIERNSIKPKKVDIENLPSGESELAKTCGGSLETRESEEEHEIETEDSSAFDNISEEMRRSDEVWSSEPLNIPINEL